jgi:hypothetical protein
LLNILYDPRIRPGMTRTEVENLLPVILPRARELVGRNNTRDQASTSAQTHSD